MLIIGRGVDFDDLDYGYKEEDKSTEKVMRSEWSYIAGADVHRAGIQRSYAQISRRRL